MSSPYRSFSDGEIIRADDWNELQTVIKEEVRTHRHGGAAEGTSDPRQLGGRLRARSLRDGSVTTEKIAENSVSSRVIAKGTVTPEHFIEDAAIDEGKILFDPDEPVAYAIAEVTLALPQGVVDSGEDVLWAIPAGTPITNDVGDLVFRTTAPVAVSSEEPTVDVAVRCDQPGAHCNVPAGTLTRVGGALDPFLRAHVTVIQQAAAQGGLEPTEEQPPQPARAPVEFSIDGRAPRTFWVIPKRTRVFQPGAGPDDPPLEFLTRRSLTVFPGSNWAVATAAVAGAEGNLAAGLLTIVDDPLLAAVVAVDQPGPATGGEAGTSATTRLRFRLRGAMPTSGVEIPAGTVIKYMDAGSATEVAFTTDIAIAVDAGGADYVLADPAVVGQGDPLPGVP
ncbi:MAG: baseplate J/gp47 family protein, partial [Myxococcota bacterium]